MSWIPSHSHCPPRLLGTAVDEGSEMGWSLVFRQRLLVPSSPMTFFWKYLIETEEGRHEGDWLGQQFSQHLET